MPVGRLWLQRSLRPLMPVYRLVRRRVEYWCARRKAAEAGGGDVPNPIAFVIGSGRSGTTLVGALLAQHEGIRYLFEPWHLWTAINSRTDSNNFYGSLPALCLMDGADCSGEQRERFDRLIRSKGRTPDELVVEKSPINAMRIGYLEAIAPGARYVNVLRDGGDVARSIARIAGQTPYRVGIRQRVNQWWGSDSAKWVSLARDGAAAGYFPDEVHGIEGDLARGAYEWLISVREVDRLRSSLGDRILDVKYDDLMDDPEPVLTGIARFLGVSADEEWLQMGIRSVCPSRYDRGRSIGLPPQMAAAFNSHQEALGFATRAHSAEGPEAGARQP
jgi:hypothetical protein